MNAQQLFEEIHSYCILHSNEDIVKKYARYFKEGYDAYGVTTELMLAKANEITKSDWFSKELLYKCAPILIKTSKYEETGFAILLLKHFNKSFDSQSFEEISKWFDIGINNWGHTDVICSELLSVFLLKKNMQIKEFSSWVKSDRRFKRRAVPVTLIKKLKTQKDYSELFTFIEPLMSDKERVVHQGMGWFLREAWKKKPLETEEFLLKWKDTAPRLIFQYATEKMTPENKKRFRKSK